MPDTIGTTMVVSISSTCWDRIKPELESRDWGVQQLADALGVSYQAVAKVRDGGAFGTKNNIKVAGLFGLNPTWLATGQGPRRAEISPAPDPVGDAAAPGTPVLSSSMRRIWAVGKGAGGAMPERVWRDSDYPVGATDMYAELGSNDPNAFLAEVVGQSMYPKYENKNFALIEPNTPIDLEDCVLVRLLSGQTMLKRLLSRRNGITLGSYNDPDILNFEDSEISWMYYSAHEVPRKKIKSRY